MMRLIREDPTHSLTFEPIDNLIGVPCCNVEECDVRHFASVTGMQQIGRQILFLQQAFEESMKKQIGKNVSGNVKMFAGALTAVCWSMVMSQNVYFCSESCAHKVAARVVGRKRSRGGISDSVVA